MKPSLPFISLGIAFSFSLAFAQDEQVRHAYDATSARVIGEIPDGTPPPPQLPISKFIIPAEYVLESKTHRQGGREITIQRIAPIALPPVAEVAPLIDLNDPVVQERIAALRAKYSDDEILRLGATVYRSLDSPPRTLVSYWAESTDTPITFWSSADFALLSGFASFVGSDGAERSLMMTWSVTDLERRNALQEKNPGEFEAPEIPAFPPGKATFIVDSGNPTQETLASIQSLHDLYNNEHGRLKAAYEGRERAQRLREAELKANPPKPKDIVINYWRAEPKSKTSGKGTAR